MLLKKEFVFSKEESKRFNLRVFRNVLSEINPEFIKSEIKSKHIELAIIRIPVELSNNLHKLSTIGLTYFVADTLVYYYNNLINFLPTKLSNNDLVFVPFTEYLLQSMYDLIDEIFKNYTNHYHSNPLISVDIAEAYKEWAKNYLLNARENVNSWLIQLGGKNIAFIICLSNMKETEVILNGVIPSESGKNVYGDMIKYIQSFFKDLNCETIKISTQLTNYAVQKVWVRNSFVLKEAFYTVHINNAPHQKK